MVNPPTVVTHTIDKTAGSHLLVPFSTLDDKLALEPVGRCSCKHVFRAG